MKLLVLEENEKISSIYKKILEEKNYEVDFAKNELEFLERYDPKYDCVILENSNSVSKGFVLGKKIREQNPNQKIWYLKPNSEAKIESEYLSETRKIIEKPFALLTILTKMEFDSKKISKSHFSKNFLSL